MINLYVTEEQLHTIHNLLGREFLTLSNEKNDPNKSSGQITERQYAKCLNALATICTAVEKHHRDSN